MMLFRLVSFNIHSLIIVSTAQIVVVAVVVVSGAIFGFTRMKMLIALILFYFRADVFYHHLADLCERSLFRMHTVQHWPKYTPCTHHEVQKRIGAKRQEMESASTI